MVDKRSRSDGKLRIYKENGGKIYELVKYRKEKKQREMKEIIQKEVDKNIKKKRNRYLDKREYLYIN